MPEQSDDLHREGEPSQTTDKGLKIPVPEQVEFEDFLEGVKRTPKKPNRKNQPPTPKKDEH